MNREFTYQEVVERLAPCGLDCERCVMYAKGRVKNSATDLMQALEGFENMAPKVADRFPALAGYDGFVEILKFFAGAQCAGCREGFSPPLPFCAARTCFREQGVDFCYQCAEYPCRRNSYQENMETRWRSYNDRMREVGAERYYQESLDKPRY